MFLEKATEAILATLEKNYQWFLSDIRGSCSGDYDKVKSFGGTFCNGQDLRYCYSGNRRYYTSELESYTVDGCIQKVKMGGVEYHMYLFGGCSYNSY